MKNIVCALLLGTALAARAEAPRVYTDNVVILLDGSGSMAERLGGETKIQAAKRAIREVLAGVPETTHVGLLVFTQSSRNAGWVYPLGPRNDEALHAALGLVEARGGTPLGEYIKRAADRLLEERERQYGYGTYRLLVVTDGEATDGNLTEQYAPQIVARGIVMDVIGVDMRSNHKLAGLAHSYRRADDPASLRQAISEVLAEVGSAAGQDTSQEAFDLIAGIPDNVAAAMLGALSTYSNRRIGEKGEAVAEPGAKPASGPGPSAKKSSRSNTGVIVLLVVAAIITSIIRSIGRRR